MTLVGFSITIFVITFYISIVFVILDDLLLDLPYVKKKREKQFQEWFFRVRNKIPSDSAFDILLDD